MVPLLRLLPGPSDERRCTACDLRSGRLRPKAGAGTVTGDDEGGNGMEETVRADGAPTASGLELMRLFLREENDATGERERGVEVADGASDNIDPAGDGKRVA